MIRQPRQETFTRRTIRGADDDPRLSGLSGVARRKMQNCLNQRKCRERKKQLLDDKGEESIRKWVIYSVAQSRELPVTGNRFNNLRSEESLPAPIVMRQSNSKNNDRILHFCNLGPSERNAFISRLRAESIGGAAGHLLNLELLLSVKQYNIFTAMARNAACMGLSMESLRHDISSPFNTGFPWSMNLPPSLRPTALQMQKPHHPWIDLFPIASVRDALLKNDQKFDDEELCHDLFGSCGKDEKEPGMFIWGESWDPSAYEISEKVVRKWLWLFHACGDVIWSSNHWRATRGEKRLVLMDSESDPLS